MYVPCVPPFLSRAESGAKEGKRDGGKWKGGGRQVDDDLVCELCRTFSPFSYTQD